MAPTLLLALLLSANTIAVPLNDTNATSVTNGQSTLVAWGNAFGNNPLTSRIFIRLLDSPFDRNAVSLGSGLAPHVATNGRDYLVGWSMQPSRFTYFVGDTAAVQLVSADGVAGTRKVISHSSYGGVTAVAWNGTHWMVANHYSNWSSGSGSRVLMLDESLNSVATIDAGGAHVRAFRRIGDRWWAFSDTEAIEIYSDGTPGQRFTPDAPIGGTFSVTHEQRPLLLVQGEAHIDAIPFDPDNGFGSRRPFLASANFLSIVPYEDGSLLLHAPSPATQYDVTFIDGTGEVRNQWTALFTPMPQSPWASLGVSVNGPLFFFSPDGPNLWATGGIDLYAFPLQWMAPLDLMFPKRVSQLAAPGVRRRAARH